MIRRLLGARTFVSLRKHRNYRLYFAGNMVSTIGTFMSDVSLPWVMFQLTHSPVAVGVLFACRYIPLTIFGLFSGILADRVDNFRYLYLTQLGQAVIAGIVTVAVFSHTATPWLLDVLALGGGVVTMLASPLSSNLVFRLVGRDDLANAVGLGSIVGNTGRVVGPSIAGVTIAAVGAGWCFAANTASFGAVLVALSLIRPDEFFPLQRASSPPRVLEGFVEAARFVRRSVQFQVLLGLGMINTIVLFSSRALWPVLAARTLHSGAVILGLLFAFFGIGALIGAVWTATLGRASIRRMLAGSAAFTVAILALAPLSSPILAIVFCFLIGVGHEVFIVNSQMIVQLTAPEHMRGRLIGFWMFAQLGFLPLSGVITGELTHLGGTRLAFGTAGLLLAAALIASMLRLRQSPTAFSVPSGRRPVDLATPRA